MFRNWFCLFFSEKLPMFIQYRLALSMSVIFLLHYHNFTGVPGLMSHRQSALINFDSARFIAWKSLKSTDSALNSAGKKIQSSKSALNSSVWALISLKTALLNAEFWQIQNSNFRLIFQFFLNFWKYFNFEAGLILIFSSICDNKWATKIYLFNLLGGERYNNAWNFGFLLLLKLFPI